MKLGHLMNVHLLSRVVLEVHRVLCLLLFCVREHLSPGPLGFRPSVVLQLLQALLDVLLLLHLAQIELLHHVLQQVVLLLLLVQIPDALSLAAPLDLS